MVIKSQNGKDYNIHTLSTEGNCVYCREVTDRRIKVLLGKYNDISRATEVFNEARRYIGKCYVMPQE